MDVIKLIDKKLKGNLSKEEKKYFEDWIDASYENRSMFFRLETLKNKGIDFSNVTNLDSELAWIKVNEKVVVKANRKKEYYSLKRMFKYAAILLCFITLSYSYSIYNASVDQNIRIDENAITLELGNGEVKVLASTESQIITDSQGNIMSTRDGNQLNYSHSTIKENLVYNTLNIPNGKRFNVVLSDGSIVHLNAGSSLKYPVKFLKNEERHVFLKGEAYFEVSKDKKHPFIVSSENMNIKVLGTKFNVTSYPEDIDINTVLVEGSVSLYSNSANNEIGASTLLESGYKATWEKSKEEISLKKVDTNTYVGWLNGKLVLKKVPFKDILQKLQRFYNVSISNEYKALNNRIFTATFDIETVEEALNIFILDTYFEYEILDNKITIHQPK